MAWKNTSKFYNQKTKMKGRVFDSRKEARRWRSLKLLEQAGEIKNLQRQVKYLLIPEAREPDEIGPRGGVKKGKIILTIKKPAKSKKYNVKIRAFTKNSGRTYYGKWTKKRI